MVQRTILQAIEQFAQAQEEQYAALCAGQRPDWVAWYEKRAKAFRVLQHELAALDALGGSGEDAFVKMVREKVGELLEAEKRLNEAVAQRQSDVAAQMASIRRGKSALNKLSVHRGGMPPRFLSSKA